MNGSFSNWLHVYYLEYPKESVFGPLLFLLQMTSTVLFHSTQF